MSLFVIFRQVPSHVDLWICRPFSELQPTVALVVLVSIRLKTCFVGAEGKGVAGQVNERSWNYTGHMAFTVFSALLHSVVVIPNAPNNGKAVVVSMPLNVHHEVGLVAASTIILLPPLSSR